MENNNIKLDDFIIVNDSLINVNKVHLITKLHSNYHSSNISFNIVFLNNEAYTVYIHIEDIEKKIN